jgi:hypothetical protein
VYGRHSIPEFFAIMSKKQGLIRFSKTYFGLTILLFIIETLIALCIHDDFIRPYFGDVLVVILIYCFIKSFLNLPVWPAAILVLLFAFCIEGLQYVNLVEKLHLEKSKLATTVLGNSFALEDLLAYAAGVVAIIIIEKAMKRKRILKNSKH